MTTPLPGPHWTCPDCKTIKSWLVLPEDHVPEAQAAALLRWAPIYATCCETVEARSL